MAQNFTQQALNERLFIAADLDDVPAIKQALKDGADVDARNDRQSTPLDRAAWSGHTDAAKALLEAGAEVNTSNGATQSTALHWAAWKGNTVAARALLAAGADLALKDKDGNTPIDKARSQKHPELANYLQSIANSTIKRPTPKEVGLDMNKRNAALAKPIVGEHTAKVVTGMEAQRQAALNDPSEGI